MLKLSENLQRSQRKSISFSSHEASPERSPTKQSYKQSLVNISLK